VAEPLGHELDNVPGVPVAGACPWRALALAVGFASRDEARGVSRFDPDVEPDRVAAPDGSAGAAGFAMSPTTASVSWTGRSAVADGMDADSGVDGVDVAASGAGTAFCREAR
jgi:hypothetical protein